ncbi:intercellular trafficking and secretion [Savitreella phatthalungensis]
MSYLVTTRSSLPVFQKAEFAVRRRYNDFCFLHATLVHEYAACIVPPLPDKHAASAYIKVGGRFDADFVGRRCHSLERFLSRCALHPEIKHSKDLHVFLESGDWNAYVRTRAAQTKRTGAASTSSVGADDGVMEGLKDSLMSAFTKSGKAERKFVDVRDRSDKLAKDLAQIERLVGKIVRREVDVENDAVEMAKQFARLGEYEPALEAEFTSFSKALADTAAHLRTLRDHTDAAYLTSLHDQSAFNVALKQLLKARDQKQSDFEALSEYQDRTVVERDQVASGYNTSSLLQQKVDNLRGLNHESQRRDKLRKLEAQASRLQEETDKARTQSDAFDEAVVRECAVFEEARAEEMRASMRQFARANADFYRTIIDDWQVVLARGTQPTTTNVTST